MATIKIKIRFSNAGTSAGRVVYQVIHRRVIRRIASGISVRKDMWEEATSRVVMPPDAIGDLAVANEMRIANTRIDEDMEAIRSIIDGLEGRYGGYSADDIVDAFQAQITPIPFPDFMEEEIYLKEKSGKMGTVRTYTSALRRLRAFAAETGYDINIITADLMEEYESWLSQRGVVNNSISFYMRALRAVYSRMVKTGMVRECHPFANVYTGIAKTRKRAISETDLRKVRMLNLSGDNALEMVRDMFLLSFYMMGISFVDMAFLKKTDMRNEVISYCRAKTGQSINIGVNAKILHMLDKHPSATDSPYLLPIISDPKGDTRKQYLNALREFNKKLKKIGERIGLADKLTTYTSRHSWASIARTRNVELSVISDALGHQSEATTRIYLATLDTGRISRANDIILRGF
ncbi:tyrosine-type recombinase/integrase [Lepagella muris]|jgi:site-specific recombinase XerD|uniref:Site-specific integrase n=1 Tax=Lepagella muris TaxID=3032870 RepID=A0AC61RL93_9BACT|nr:site-specific integrase [Lepagella muris]ROT07642.1 site-specific integrase [Muribaculaceae bacterium Isolate-037 (Harlan)]TGY81085.1 site-specific integrase [Lepagella muris]THG54163.1 site-specific integrase [Bacteroidales bacterium]